MVRLLHRLFRHEEPDAVAAARDAREAIEAEVHSRRREAAATRMRERERHRHLDTMIAAVNDRTNPLADDLFGPPPLRREPR